MKEYGTVSGIVKDRPEDIADFYKGVNDDEPKERIYFQPREHESEVEEEPAYDAFTYARDIVDTTIAQSDYFIESALESGIDTADTENSEYLRHLATITKEYLSDPTNEEFFREIDGGETYTFIKILGTAPYALRQQRTLDHAKSSSNKSGVEHAKKTVIEFNHDILQLVETNPGLRLTDLASQIDLASTFYDSDAKGTAHNDILDIAYGIRTEYAFLQAVSASSQYNIRHGTADEDRHGVDFVVILPDGTELSIDVKSSLSGISEVAAEPSGNQNFVKKDERSFAYHLDTSEEDFLDGSFALELSAKIKLRRTVLEALQTMSRQ